MKAQIAAKYLQFLNKKNANKNSGFTLIELLVVIIIIGILSAIALPSFLGQTAKARASEAKTNVGGMNRAQQAYFLENQRFAGDADASATPVTLLGLSMRTTTDNFNYTVQSTTPTTSAIQKGTSRKADIKSYSGGVFYAATGTTTKLCESATAANADGVITPAGDPTSGGCAGSDKEIK